MMIASRGDFFALPVKQVGHVQAVDDAILRHRASGDLRKSREQVHLVDDFIADRPGGDLARPADGKRHPQTALKRRDHAGAPRAGRARRALLNGHGVAGGGVSDPLSAVKMKIVLSRTPRSSTVFINCPT